jgi:hypothetical protein
MSERSTSARMPGSATVDRRPALGTTPPLIVQQQNSPKPGRYVLDDQWCLPRGGGSAVGCPRARHVARSVDAGAHHADIDREHLRARGRNCLVLTQWTAHVALLANLLRSAGHEPVVPQGGMGAGQRRAALERLRPGDGPLLVIATGPYVGEGFDCPAPRHPVPRPLRSRSKVGSCSTSAGCCARRPASTSSRCTIITTSRPGSSRHRCASVRPATGAWASPTRARRGITRHDARAEQAPAARGPPRRMRIRWGRLWLVLVHPARQARSAERA